MNNFDVNDSNYSFSYHSHHSSPPEEELLAKRETRNVKLSKLCVLAVIACATIASGIGIYYSVNSEEEEDFRLQFDDFATQVVENAHYEANIAFKSVESMSASITSFALDASSDGINRWPYVTVPHFEIRGENTNKVSRAAHLSMVPLVTVADRMGWEMYSVGQQGWIAEGLKLREDEHLHDGTFSLEPISQTIWRYKGEVGDSDEEPETTTGVSSGHGHYGPVWQQAAAPHDTHIINYNLLSHPLFARAYHSMYEYKTPIMSEVADFSFLHEDPTKHSTAHPHSALLYPIYSNLNSDLHSNIVGFLVAILPWDFYFRDLLPQGTNGIIVVLQDTCAGQYTYQINGPESVFLGEGDLHDRKYDYLEVSNEFLDFKYYEGIDGNKECHYDIRVYPSAELEQQYRTSIPIIYTSVLVSVFVFMALVFILYDKIVELQQEKMLAAAARTTKIVSSLFPSNVRDRIFKDVEEQGEEDFKKSKSTVYGEAPKAQLRDFLQDNDEERTPFETKPIADLFPSATIMFADMVGFTAWSSVREPAHVFTLLETVYHAFDEIAKLRRVFKVETIGDCYVAVCGLPDHRKDHAVVMARFANDCLKKMNEVVKKLEVTLGPDTGDLTMRFGLHTGPVTAGVLRGDKSRFQLFGDSVNTASRIENTGERDRIHLSQETADILVSSGKSHWVVERDDKVVVRGKGEMQTYWLDIKVSSGDSIESGDTDGSEEHLKTVAKSLQVSKTYIVKTGRLQRMVHWNTDILARLLKQVVARRKVSEAVKMKVKTVRDKIPTTKKQDKDEVAAGTETVLGEVKDTVLGEVKDIIEFPEFDAKAAQELEDHEPVELDDIVIEQLRDFVTLIADMYSLDNPFHNFEHASHVSMSVSKLLSRIVAPDLPEKLDVKGSLHSSIHSSIHDHTYGITSDPMTQFACVFSGLIHDVDHQGVPNAQLVKEKADIAIAYKNKSVAEQNSLDISWDLLMDDSFSALREAIFTNEEEKKHFRELLVNSVMATDISDKELGAARKARWNCAFATSPIKESQRDAVNRKATIVIEHLIQASDVAHTMQHWHIYRKWNERLFQELYLAYKNGRADKDPSKFWYQGEIGFFDYYVIPLAKKLKDCGVFGVSSDEYLNYAEKNREEWELRGQEVVASMVDKCWTKFHGNNAGERVN